MMKVSPRLRDQSVTRAPGGRAKQGCSSLASLSPSLARGRSSLASLSLSLVQGRSSLASLSLSLVQGRSSLASLSLSLAQGRSSLESSSPSLVQGCFSPAPGRHGLGRGRSTMSDRVLPRHFGPGALATDRDSLLSQSSFLMHANRVPWRQ